MSQTGIQTAVSLIYPPRCLTCGETVDSDFGLCGNCWKDTAFIGGAVCDCCGTPLPGEASDDIAHCDGCLRQRPPWARGRAALIYRDTGRKLVLGLKHGDRQEVARPAALWMSNAARDILLDNMLIAPVPLHWLRLLRRRYNQSALLARALSLQTGLAWCPDLLLRTRRTATLDKVGRSERFAMLRDAIIAHPKRRHKMSGRPVLLVDDVMTTGATLTACTEACFQAGALAVHVVTLARAAKDT